MSNMSMKLVLGADHGGFKMKERVKKWLGGLGHEVVDVGAVEEIDGDDYVDFAVKVAKILQSGGKGILFCRNGFGMAIVANRFKGVRCGFGFNERAVKKGRLDDDINCLAIPADYVDVGRLKEMIEVFLKTEFSGEERYTRRLNKLNNLTK